MIVKDERQQALEQWASSLLGESVLGVPASSDASFRRYFRCQLSTASIIAMDAPPGRENNPAFVDVAERLAKAGLRVPEIIAYDEARGFLLLSDLGEHTYLNVLNEKNADALFKDAIAALLLMQQGTSSAGLVHYDETMLRKELALFPEWYLKTHLGLTISPSLSQMLEQLFDQLIAQITQQAKVFVHRDFMPRNLMYTESVVSGINPGILDFQDAVFGPISYDPICLFKDAFLSWPEHQVQAWLRSYWLQAIKRQLPVPQRFEQFLIDCDYMAVQRHLKVIGIFARINYRDGKSQYLGDVPRFFAYLRTIMARRPELKALASLFDAVTEQVP